MNVLGYNKLDIENVDLLTGTIAKTPTANSDIARKDYVDTVAGAADYLKRVGTELSPVTSGDSLSCINNGTITGTHMVTETTTPVNNNELVSKIYFDSKTQLISGYPIKCISGGLVRFTLFVPTVSNGNFYSNGTFTTMNAIAGGNFDLYYTPYASSPTTISISTIASYSQVYNLPTGPGVDFTSLSSNYYTFMDVYIHLGNFTLSASANQYSSATLAINDSTSTIHPSGLWIGRIILKQGLTRPYDYINYTGQLIEDTGTINIPRSRVLINNPNDSYAGLETLKIKTIGTNSPLAFVCDGTTYPQKAFYVGPTGYVNEFWNAFNINNAWYSSTGNRSYEAEFEPTAGVLVFKSGSGSAGTLITNWTDVCIMGNSIFRLPTCYSYAVGGTNKALYIDSNGYVGYNSSLEAHKTNITSIVDENWIYDLRPVTFNRRKKDTEGKYTNEAETLLEHGLIAEEVEKVNDLFCYYDNNTLQGVAYDKLITPLIKCVQDQKKEIDNLKINLNKLVEVYNAHETAYSNHIHTVGKVASSGPLDTTE